MELASLIISIFAIILGGASLVWQLAQRFSTHKIQYVPVDPFKPDLTEPGQVGNNLFDAFRDLGEPVDSEELEQIERLRTRKIKK